MWPVHCACTMHQLPPLWPSLRQLLVCVVRTSNRMLLPRFCSIGVLSRILSRTQHSQATRSWASLKLVQGHCSELKWVVVEGRQSSNVSNVRWYAIVEVRSLQSPYDKVLWRSGEKLGAQ